MRYTTLFFLSIVLFSCKSQPHSTKYAVSDTTYLDLKGKGYKNLGTIPDSLRTPEQIRLTRTLTEVTINYMSVKDNHLVFELTKEQFLEKGIPERYYVILQQNIRDNNDFFDSNGIKNVDKMMQERKDDYYHSLQEQKKR